MTVHLEHDAELEMLEAARHYEEQQSGLGSDFLDEVDFSLEQIRRGAERFGFYRRSKIVRSVRLERFPYLLLFVVEAELAIVVAVMHLHRRPDYWKKRIR